MRISIKGPALPAVDFSENLIFFNGRGITLSGGGGGGGGGETSRAPPPV